MKGFFLVLLLVVASSSVAYSQVLSCNPPYTLTVSKHQQSGDNLICPGCAGHISLNYGNLNPSQPFTLTIDGISVVRAEILNPGSGATKVDFEASPNIYAPSLPYNSRSVYVTLTQNSIVWCGVTWITKSNAYFLGTTNITGVPHRGTWQIDGTTQANDLATTNVKVGGSASTFVAFAAYNIGITSPTGQIPVKLGNYNFTGYVTIVGNYNEARIIIILPPSFPLGTYHAYTYYGGRYSPVMTPITIEAL